MSVNVRERGRLFDFDEREGVEGGEGGGGEVGTLPAVRFL